MWQRGVWALPRRPYTWYILLLLFYYFFCYGIWLRFCSAYTFSICAKNKWNIWNSNEFIQLKGQPYVGFFSLCSRTNIDTQAHTRTRAHTQKTSYLFKKRVVRVQFYVVIQPRRIWYWTEFTAVVHTANERSESFSNKCAERAFAESSKICRLCAHQLLLFRLIIN